MTCILCITGIKVCKGALSLDITQSINFLHFGHTHRVGLGVCMCLCMSVSNLHLCVRVCVIIKKKMSAAFVTFSVKYRALITKPIKQSQLIMIFLVLMKSLK